MQVETLKDLISAYSTQVCWLENRLHRLKKEGFETSPISGTVQAELDWAKNALDRLRAIDSSPKGKLVQVVKSKVSGLRNKVGKVTYVNTDRNYATVTFDGGASSHSLSLKNLVVIDIPVPSVRVPAPGMVVKFKDDPEDYVAILWAESQVYVEPMSSVISGQDEWDRHVKRRWVERDTIETINGERPL